jgi:hypothetical protein
MRPPSEEAVHDGSAALFAHHLKLELHAAPDASQVDAHDAVEVVARRVGRFCKDILNACVVVSRVETSERRDSLLHHGFDLRIIGYVTMNGECLVSLVGEVFGCGLYFFFVPVGEHDGCASFSEGLCCRETQSGRSARYQGDLVFKRDIHSSLLDFGCVRQLAFSGRSASRALRGNVRLRCGLRRRLLRARVHLLW